MTTWGAALQQVVNEAHRAYIDPTTGSLMTQLLFGGVAGLLGIGRLYWHAIKTKFKRLFSKRTDSGTTQDDLS